MTSPLDDLLDKGLGAAFAVDETRRAPEAPLPARIGRYAIRSLLGRGGLGTVYLGHDDELDRDVAIKVLNQGHGGDEGLLQRFREEAKTCSQLQHPGIVSVHELGTTADHRLYYTMRVVTGETLQQLLRRTVPAPSDRRRFLAILELAAQAVAFAHSHGVVHGDLTPANIMVGEFGEVQVLDWGLSRRALADAGTPPGAAGRAIGTPAYMAPEQAVGARAGIGRPTDVFGLGAILCEILTGAPPYTGASVFQVHQRASQGAIEDAVVRLRSVTGDRELAELACACLDPEPGKRPADAAAVAHALASHLQAIDARAHAFELEAIAQQERAKAARRARRLTTLLATVVVLTVLVACAAWLWWRGEQDERRARANERAVAALSTARQLSGMVGDHGSAKDAMAAVVTAAEAAAAADVDPAHRAAANTLRTEVATRMATIAQDDATRQSLADHRWHAGDDRTVTEIEADYVAAFTRCGIDVEHEDRDRTVKALQGHRLHLELAAAMHWWALQRRRSGFPTGDAWLPMLELADRSDLDPRRRELRRAFLGGDVARLRTLAEDRATVEMAPETIGLLGRLLVACDDVPAAIRLLRRAHVRHPADYDLCHDLSSLLAGEPEPPLQEVTALATVGAALRPQSPHALVDLAMALLEERRVEDARPVAARAVALDPAYGRGWLCTARVREVDGDVQGAVAALREYGRLQPGAHPPLLLSRLLERVGRADEALAAARQAVAASPRSGDALMHLGRLLFERVALVEAIDVLERAVPLAREPGPTCFLLGRALSLGGLHARALGPLRRAQSLLPGNPHVGFMLGVALVATGQLDEGVRLLTAAETAGRQLPDWPYPATILVRAKELQAAEPELELLLRTGGAPDAARASLLGELALAKGEPAAAMRIYAAACAARPDLAASLADRRGRAAARVAFLPRTTPSDDDERRRDASESLLRLQESLRYCLGKDAANALATNQRRKLLSVWLLAPELAATRAPEPPAWLRVEDRNAWRELWAAVDRALAQP